MISAQHLRLLVVRPALRHIDAWSSAAENLVMGTAAQESNLIYLKQLGGGPALGLWQMEPDTHLDIWDNYLAYRPELASSVRDLAGRYWPGAFEDPATEMVTNLAYAAAMCRIHYKRVPEALPDADNMRGLAKYWKQHYNTVGGSGSVGEFLGNYNRVIA